MYAERRYALLLFLKTIFQEKIVIRLAFFVKSVKIICHGVFFVVALIYGVVVCVATLLGAFVGLGGGVVIKPVLDVIGAHPLEQISFISSCAVFAMSVTSMAKHIRNKTPIKASIVLLVAAGSVAGGICGNSLFSLAMKASGMPELVKGIQSAILAAFLACVILSVVVKHRTFHVANPLAILFAGFLLGTAASFLGIGGGPINVAFLTLLFSFSMKDAAVYSVAVIFFSQCSNLITTGIKTGFAGYDLKILLVVIPCAIVGGFVGSVLNRRCKESSIRKVFVLAVSAVACLSLYNAVTAFITSFGG